jgi:hypothetical protein
LNRLQCANMIAHLTCDPNDEERLMTRFQGIVAGFAAVLATATTFNGAVRRNIALTPDGKTAAAGIRPLGPPPGAAPAAPR